MKVPNGLKEMIRLYGNPRLHGFESQNIVSFKTPAFRKRKPFTIRCHRLIKDELEHTMLAIAKLETTLDKALIKDYGGCYVYRPMRTSSRMSTHSWGISLDFNVVDNPLGHTPSQSQALVKVFTDSGWEWGGNWHNPDGMHFQRVTNY